MIVAKTKMRKIPAACRKCSYYQAEQYSVYGKDPGLCLLLWHGTAHIVVSRQRLPECPLTEIDRNGGDDNAT